MNTETLVTLIDPVVTDLGFELYGCELHAYSTNKLLRIYIDKAEGITVDDCAAVSHSISALFDVEDPITGRYQLEVSSPGLDRPLFSLAHFERFIGATAKVRLKQKVAGRKNFIGTIKQVDGSSVVLEFDDEANHCLSDIVFDFEELGRANLVPNFAE